MKPLGSLTNRIFLATAALAVLSIGVALFVINRAVSRQAEEELGRGLREAADLVEHYRSVLFDHFAREAQLVADLPRLKAAVFEHHPPTAQPIAEDYRRQTDAAVFTITDAAGRIVAHVGPPDLAAPAVAALPAVANALVGRLGTAFVPTAQGVLQIVSVPIWIDPRQPELLGTLSVGFGFDAALAERVKRLTHSEIAFAFRHRLYGATLAGLGPDAIELLQTARGVARLRVGDHVYVGLARSLAPPERASAMSEDGRVPPGDPADAPVALVLRSRTERLQFLTAVQTALAGTAIVAVLAAILLSYAVARTVTRPLETITATMREMAATGDLTRRIVLPPGRWDEDARLLASTFNTMTESIARFQQEVAQRERLSSLGRLSTVMAHEIRNPLMIIKAALRTLRREPAPTESVREAIADIDEEVARLNRLVTEVLDFARPIQFRYAPVDLNRLCADAAAAAGTASGGECAVHLALAPEVGEIATDGERLRLALVNVLTNARHAVEERPPASVPDGQASTEPAVELATSAAADGRITVVVRDRGVGIAPEDLPRIFDPFFTTKRTGSGLGLAIARNIVEGLGGTIEARPRPGGGTEVVIALPPVAPGVGRETGTTHAS